jgi:hypothetical protein
MKTEQPSPDATKVFHSNEMMGKKISETLAWVVDKLDAVSINGKFYCILREVK